MKSAILIHIISFIMALIVVGIVLIILYLIFPEGSDKNMIDLIQLNF